MNVSMVKREELDAKPYEHNLKQCDISVLLNYYLNDLKNRIAILLSDQNKEENQKTHPQQLQQ